MKYLKVKGNNNLLRDNTTNAVINVNSNEYINYMRLKNNKLKNEEYVDSLHDEINSLKKDIDEIKELLKTISNMKS